MADKRRIDLFCFLVLSCCKLHAAQQRTVFFPHVCAARINCLKIYTLHLLHHRNSLDGLPGFSLAAVTKHSGYGFCVLIILTQCKMEVLLYQIVDQNF